MERHEMLEVLRFLADGVNPETHVIYDVQSPYQNTRIVRALFHAIRELESREMILPPGGKMKSGKPSIEVPSLNPSEIILFQELRIWRNEAAREANGPAFIILSNASLMQIAYFKPTTNDELLKIYGVGPSKAKAFGPAIISIVQKHLNGGMSEEAELNEEKTVTRYVLKPK